MSLLERRFATSSQQLSPPLKWHCSGGKNYLAARIVELMPPHLHYVEPFAGGLSVLLAKNPEGISEVVCDLNGWLTNFWSVLRDPELFGEFHRKCEATPFSESLFDASQLYTQPAEPALGDLSGQVNAAWWFFIKCRMSMAGRMASFAPLSRNRVRRGMNEQASAWLTSIEGLPVVHKRLIRVVILNGLARDVIGQQDGENTLFYLDPPYAAETRMAKKTYGKFEMTEKDHVELLDAACRCEGKVIISGYDCDLYRSKLASWRRREFDVPNNAASGTEKRRMIEVVWCNFESAGAH